jgi:hypothetical protein
MEQTRFGSKNEINYINGLRDSFKLINRERIFITSNPIHLAHAFYTHKFPMHPLTFRQQISISINAFITFEISVDKIYKFALILTVDKLVERSHDSSVGRATGYGLDGPCSIPSTASRQVLEGPPSLLSNKYRG